MKRVGYTGDVWPDEIQELLLKAALLPGQVGEMAWASVRPRIDVDSLPGELHRLMPLLWKALAARAIDDPDLPRLRGVYQFTWYRNQRLFADGSALLGALQAADIPSLILRGAAVATAHCRDAGVRPMNDLDVLVPAAEADRARKIAESVGWRTVRGSEQLERREAAAALRNDQGRVVRLHWQPSPNMSLPDAAWEPMWQRAVDVTFHHTPTRVPAAADHLVQACIDGARANSGSLLRWITDVMALLSGHPGVNWDVVTAEARRHHVSLLVGEALRYLVEALDAGVPREVIETLATAPTTSRERLAHRLCLTTTPRVPALAETLGRFTRLTADQAIPRVAAAAPGFLQAILGLGRLRDLPVAAARKAGRAIVSPTPPLASLSEAGPSEVGRKPARKP
jgi:Uncharacterised nucleotidyltransferase